MGTTGGTHDIHRQTLRRPASLRPVRRTRRRAGCGAARPARVLAARARPDARADRALPGRLAVPGADGIHLSARSGGSSALVARPRGPERRGCRARRPGSGLGPERQVAARLPRPARAHGRKARLDQAPGRRLPRAGAACDGDGAAAAAQGGGCRAARVRRTPARCRRGRCPRHRTGESAGRVCPVLRPAGGLRKLVVARLPAGRLGAVARLRGGALGILVGRGRGRLGRLLLRRGRLAAPVREGRACAQSLCPAVRASTCASAAASRQMAAPTAGAQHSAPALRAPGAADAARAERLAASALYRHDAALYRADAARDCPDAALHRPDAALYDRNARNGPARRAARARRPL